MIYKKNTIGDVFALNETHYTKVSHKDEVEMEELDDEYREKVLAYQDITELEFAQRFYPILEDFFFGGDDEN